MTNALGIDVGKKELVACFRSSDGLPEPPVFFPNSSIGLKRFLRHLKDRGVPSDTPMLLESTGPYHWQAAATLTHAGYAAKVVNPLHTKQMLRHSIRKRKTDPVDAGHLAVLAAQGYGYLFCETKESATRKALVRHYWKLWSTANRHAVHEQYLREFRGIAHFGIASLIRKRCERLKEEVIQAWSAGNDLRYLDSIPGVTPFLAATLLAELTPLDRFSRVEQVVAFAGLDPSVKQSGGKAATYGKLSKRGSPILRQALFFAAFGCFSKPPFHALYRSYKDRGLHHTAILCILSRKILRIAVTLLRKRERFQARHVHPVNN